MNSTLLIIAGAYAGYKCIKEFVVVPKYVKANLKKYNNSDKVKILELPDSVYEPVDEELAKQNPVYDQAFETFGMKIESIIPREDLNNYYRNFATLKESETDRKHFLRHLLRGELVGGSYDPQKNSVALKTTRLSKYMGSVNHELLHASTTYYDKENKVIYCGFEQMFIKDENEKKGESYAMGINEGYTQYLNIKLFGNEVIGQKAYAEQQVIAKALEFVVGEEKMRSMYFRADSNGLFKELEKYVSRDELYKFINVTDILCVMGRFANRKMPEIAEAQLFVNNFILKLIVKAKGINPSNLSYETFEMLKEYIPYPKTEGITINLSSEEKTKEENEEVGMGGR